MLEYQNSIRYNDPLRVFVCALLTPAFCTSEKGDVCVLYRRWVSRLRETTTSFHHSDCASGFITKSCRNKPDKCRSTSRYMSGKVDRDYPLFVRTGE